MMGIILTIIGFGWVLIGIVNFASTNDFQPGNEMALGVAVVLHVVVYFFPGLVIGSLGLILNKKKA